MINEAGRQLIKSAESLRLTAYLCPAGVPTIFYGHTDGVTMADVKNKRTGTVEDAERMFRDDMLAWERRVRALLHRQPNENQIAAFVSFAFNVGLNGFASSSVLKAYEAYDDDAAVRAFMLWDKATVKGKKVALPGLTARRAAEAALYATPVGVEMPVMPQAIAQEKTMSESSINRASVVAGGSATLAAVADSVGTVAQIKYSVGGLGSWAVPLLLACVIAAVGYIIWDRFKQRREGRA